MQRLAGTEPVGPAVAGRDQHRGDGGRRPVGAEKAEAAALVEVSLAQPAALAPLRDRDRERWDSVAGGAVRSAAPPAHLCPRPRVQVEPAACLGDNVRQPLIGQARFDDLQRRAFGQSIMLEAGQQPRWQRIERERATVRVPVRQRHEHLLLNARHRLGRAQRDPGQQPQPARLGQQAHDGTVPERTHREPQPEQGGAAADQHLPARPVRRQLAARVAVQLDHGLPRHEAPRLGVVHRRCPGRGRDQGSSVAGQDRRFQDSALGHRSAGQVCSGIISMAPEGHSVTQMPHPLQ